MNPTALPNEIPLSQAYLYFGHGAPSTATTTDQASNAGLYGLPTELTLEQARVLFSKVPVATKAAAYGNPYAAPAQAPKIGPPATGTPPKVTVPADRQAIKDLASSYAAKEFGESEVPAFLAIINKESGFNPLAANKTSSARGLLQFLASTAKNYGLPQDATQATAEQQISAGLKYIKDRYGSPSKAWSFHQANNWY